MRKEKDKIKIIALGGLGEIGKNITALYTNHTMSTQHGRPIFKVI